MPKVVVPGKGREGKGGREQRAENNEVRECATAHFGVDFLFFLFALAGQLCSLGSTITKIAK